jgi:hypothetical protein
MRIVFVILLSVVCAGATGAAPVSVTVSCSDGCDTAIPVVIHAEAANNAISDSIDSADQLTTTLELDPGVVWLLRAEASGYWSSPKSLFVNSDGGSVLLTLVPTASAIGALQAPPGEDFDETVMLSFRSLPERGDINGEIECEVNSLKLQCEVPVGVWDLRLRAKGYVSQYFWSTKIEKGKAPADLGTIVLARGSSVIGWVETASGPAAGSGCRIKLGVNPGGQMRDSDEQREKLREVTARTNERGFFQLSGVKPGKYVLTAEKSGYVPGQLYPVTVVEDQETTLEEPLVLFRPMTLDISLEPTVDPFDLAWLVSLVEDLGYRYKPVTKDDVAEGGIWHREGLAPGKYLLMVRDGYGSTWHSDSYDLQPGHQRVDVRIEMIPFTGNVHLGEQPIASEMRFRRGDEANPMKYDILFSSDEEGHLGGFLPQEGLWNVLVRCEDPRLHRVVKDVEVRAPDGFAEARVDVAVPDERLGGLTVDQDDMPVTEAEVSCIGMELGLQGDRQSTTTDEAGHFELHGLGEGWYMIKATSQSARSEEVQIELTPDEQRDDIKLVLIRDSQIEGRVVDSTGAGVAGATVLRFAPGAGTQSPAVTDLEGWFTLDVPRSVNELVVNVIAPGNCFLMTTISTEDTSKPVMLMVGAQSGSMRIHGYQELAARGLFPTVISRDGLTFTMVLATWSQMHGVFDTVANEGVLTVPMMEPGPYELCALKYPEVNALLSGLALTNQQACTSGYLEPGGVLELEMPGIE